MISSSMQGRNVFRSNEENPETVGSISTLWPLDNIAQLASLNDLKSSLESRLSQRQMAIAQ